MALRCWQTSQQGEKFKVSKLKAWEVSSNNKQINKTTILRSGIAQTSTGPAVVTQLYQHLHTGFLASGQSSIPYPASFCRHTHVCHTGHKSAFPQTQWAHSGRDLIIFILVGIWSTFMWGINAFVTVPRGQIQPWCCMFGVQRQK